MSVASSIVQRRTPNYVEKDTGGVFNGNVTISKAIPTLILASTLSNDEGQIDFTNTATQNARIRHEVADVNLKEAGQALIFEDMSATEFHIEVVGNAYAKAFYDYDNTAYYLNPASNSVLGGNLTLGGMYLRNNSIEENKTNGVSSIAVNYFGYAGGITQFRNFNIYDGKTNSILNISGQTKTATFAGDVVIGGNLNISGTTTYINTTELDIGDNIIKLNADWPDNTAPTENSGIEIYRGTGTNSEPSVSFLWDETNDLFTTGGQILAASSLEITGVVRDATYPNNSFIDFNNDQTLYQNAVVIASIDAVSILSDSNNNDEVTHPAFDIFTGTTDVDTATNLFRILKNGNATLKGGLTIEGSIDSGGTDMGYYQSVGTNIILKGDVSGRSGIFFESEKNGVNINNPSDYGFIQFHSYGYNGTTGENNALVLGVSNDSTDKVVLQTPYNDGLLAGYKNATGGTDLTTKIIFHEGNLTAGNNITISGAGTDRKISSSYINTLNTAGSTNTDSKIYLIGATGQSANPQTYSDSEVYTTNGTLTTNKIEVGGGSARLEYNTTTKSIDFIFA